MSDQKTCPTCGTEYPLSERFCPRDGTALRSTNAQGDLVGTIVAERYHILKKLGEGGMGTVYLAEHVKMGRKAALKVMNPGMAQDADAIARFNREAANASRLNHPNACAIYDFGETPEGLIYLAMEFIEGVSLTDLIEKNGALAAPRAAAIIHQSADALAVAHDYGIVHRDLKPDNIMIAKSRDGSDVAKVVDFGIAKASSSDAQKVTKTGLVVGTPEYMSPEQLAGDKLDGRSDISSLGLVAFNCLTGTLPFPSNSAQEAMIMRLTDHPKTLADMRPDIAWPEELQRVMDKALARDAVDRYANAAEFGRDIAKAVENMPAAMAAQEGTLVMSAAGMAGAKTVAGAALPATRVASSPAGGTQKIGAVAPSAAAPVSAASGSTMPMIVGAVVVVAGLGFAAVKFMGGGAAKPVDAANPPGTQATAPAAQAPSGAPAADRSATNTQEAAPPVSANSSRTTAVTGVTANPGAAPVRSAPSASANPVRLLNDLVARLEVKDASKADARDALAQVGAMLPSISGPTKALAYYVEHVAYATLEQVAKSCLSGQLAVDNGLTGEKLAAVKYVLATNCDK